MCSRSTSTVNFINILRTNFSCERRFGSFSLATCSYEKCARKNVDEIDTWRELFSVPGKHASIGKEMLDVFWHRDPGNEI